jgi:hypothetical protein
VSVSAQFNRRWQLTEGVLGEVFDDMSHHPLQQNDGSLTRPSAWYARASSCCDASRSGCVSASVVLRTLQHLMERVREAEGLDEVPRPCDRFDMIGGTSTGG